MYNRTTSWSFSTNRLSRLSLKVSAKWGLKANAETLKSGWNCELGGFGEWRAAVGPLFLLYPKRNPLREPRERVRIHALGYIRLYIMPVRFRSFARPSNTPVASHSGARA